MSRIDDDPFEGEDRKHATATQLAEAALRARKSGDMTKAEQLMDEAERTDPEAAANVLAQSDAVLDSATPASDEEVAAMTRTVEPHSDAPSRAGIFENEDGSGADSEKR
ncbi:hypothetical protein [Gluconobacter morbifer]|uniref:Uncharacterized protein n=1 Tax=Gluconobacter morbifer G707 TaxID=1088869 RepID=G6XFI8_9PROT|nr:hypothetical protein [Gluconobacter morbifer]EHH68947.1 hypothetical protein GMO_02530 [Gluconobacter morbifer G707]